MERNINRIKVVLVDKRKTNKWLSEQLGVSPTTVSKWCTNAAQPPLETIIAIANALEVPVQELVRQEEFNQRNKSNDNKRRNTQLFREQVNQCFC